MSAYYNEIDPFAAQWLRNLIAAGHIAPGDVDERSIADVKTDDLKGYVQCHFFAGIGVWSHALRRAGWPDDRPVWTGSCPCQPFSAAGKGEGAADPRHLWPEWFRLIRERRPVAVFGEQVSAAIRHGWLDLVSADLEGAGYAIGSAVLGAHSVGAPHIRQRLYFVADSGIERRQQDRRGASSYEEAHGAARRNGCKSNSDHLASGHGATGELADSDGRHPGAEGLQRGGEHGQQQEDGGTGGLEHATRDGRIERRAESGGRGATGGCSKGVAQGDTHDAGSQGRSVPGADRERNSGSERAARQAGAVGRALDDTESAGRRVLYAKNKRQANAPSDSLTNASDSATDTGSRSEHFWSSCDWLPCIDGKARPVEPGTFPLAHGAASRVGRLRAYGNAIVAPAAAEFIRAYLQA